METRQRTGHAGSIAGVVLAAGSSTRMGSNKLLFDLGGETVVHRAVRAASAAGLDPVIVVLGHEADKVRAALADLPCRFVLNAEFVAGMNGSVRVGIGAVPASSPAAVVMLADMPFVDVAMIATLVERYRGGNALLLASEYGTGTDAVKAPPTLFDRALFAELMGEEGHGCAKRMARRHPDRTAVLTWPARALVDLDAPADYERVKAQLQTAQQGG
ncbi:MAG TPA: nucleotidyltransferase family protein [Burkholderiaceae bacterium]|nr:nucleotidyltransferase family protein [Burkholderiaceae bacterium]